MYTLSIYHPEVHPLWYTLWYTLHIHHPEVHLWYTLHIHHPEVYTTLYICLPTTLRGYPPWYMPPYYSKEAPENLSGP